MKVTSESESNRLLRALWAVIRAEFGKLVWQYAPVEHGHRNTIYFGWAAIDNGSPVRIGVTYRRKGVIHQIVFEDAGRVRGQMEHCVKVAEERAGSPQRYTCRGLLTPNLAIPLQGTAFESVALVPSGESTIGLHMRVDAFDETDAKAEFTGKARTGADVLAAFTNLFLDFAYEGIESLPPSTPNQAGVSLPETWLDGYPIADGLLIIPEPCLRLLNSIANDSIDERKRLILNACHHFHAGRALDDLQFGPPTINTINQELALVLYLSALEAASLIDAPRPVNCRLCEQPQYQIGKRVKDLVKRHLGDAAASSIKQLYDCRSHYLHRGQLLSSRSYVRAVLPQLDSGDANGVRSPLPLTALLNLREYTSFCLRAVVRRTIDVA